MTTNKQTNKTEHSNSKNNANDDKNQTSKGKPDTSDVKNHDANNLKQTNK
ncbi:MAG: hypothetical protein PHC75_01345 [Burkholderiales bacterium]|nr:hypothetical protein [Burkholderiales bacterium]